MIPTVFNEIFKIIIDKHDKFTEANKNYMKFWSNGSSKQGVGHVAIELDKNMSVITKAFRNILIKDNIFIGLLLAQKQYR